MGLKGTIRLLAILQLLFSLAFGVTAFATYAAFEGSIGNLIRTTTGALESMSSSIARIAASTMAEQRTIDVAISTLKANRKLIDEVQAASQDQVKLLPLYAGDLRNAASIAASAGSVVSALGEKLNLPVPTSIEWEGFKPVVVYTRPMAGQAASLGAQGQELRRVGEGLSRTADALEKHGQGLGRAFVESSKSVGQLMDQLADSMLKIRTLELPMAVEDLHAAAKTLREIRDQTLAAEKLVLVILIAALLLSALFACNSLAVMLLARRLPAA